MVFSASIITNFIDMIWQYMICHFKIIIQDQVCYGPLEWSLPLDDHMGVCIVAARAKDINTLVFLILATKDITGSVSNSMVFFLFSYFSI